MLMKMTFEELFMVELDCSNHVFRTNEGSTWSGLKKRRKEEANLLSDFSGAWAMIFCLSKGPVDLRI